MNDRDTSITSLSFFFAVLVLLNFPVFTFGQQNDQPTEVYLTFQYRGIVSVYITAYYQDDHFYLSANELFNVLEIQYRVDQGNLTLSGNYLGEKEYYFDFRDENLIAKAGDREIQLTAEDFLIREIGYFIRPHVFEELFGLNFTVDFNTLTLDLQTEDKMPVVARYEREQRRKNIDRDQPLFRQNYYPLRYKRDYTALDGAFLDYNFSYIFTRNFQLLTFNNSIGAEILAGDVRGDLFGTFSDQQSTFTTQNLRWRFVKRNNNFFSTAIAGQTISEGIGNRAITGVKISNKPIEARRLFDRYVISDQTIPESEVELYLNNQLVDYQKTDQSGNYRFIVPLTYGSTDYSVRIFTPSGRDIEQNTRIQIPFDYLPPGEVEYTASFGRLNNPIIGSSERGEQAEAKVSAGITDWLTASASSEYLTNYHDGTPSFTGTLNARLFSRYLFSANVNSKNFYRFTSNVVYSNGASWNLSYDYNPGESRLYNVGGTDQQGKLSLFTPFRISNIPFNFRLTTDYFKNGNSELVRYRTNLTARLGRLNVRLGYQDQQITPLSFDATASSRVTNSYSYTVGRTPNIPPLLRGVFLRGQISYLPEFEQLEDARIDLSKEILESSRIQLSLGRNFLGGFNSVSLNFTMDFNKIRSNTTARSTASEISFNQNFRGSVAYDPYGDQLLLDNRQQVGQSGAAIRLFIDNNNDGSYQDSLDDVINDPAVRVRRAGGRTRNQNGINYISQLLPYYQYNMEIDRTALSNPLLIPDIDNFSIITDPNQYKPIEVPFYLSGVISGRVERLRADSSTTGLSGARIFLESRFDSTSNRDPFSKELRTFSDGSFYTYEVPPGKYMIYIDPTQLEFLNAEVEPDTIQFEIEALAQGDFIEGLEFNVVPDTLQSEEIIAETQPANTDTLSAEPQETNPFYPSSARFQVQLASYARYSIAEKAQSRAETLFDREFHLIFNQSTNLYAIRTDIKRNRKESLEELFRYQNSEFSEPALVVILPLDEGFTEQRYSTIQIGAFYKRTHAEKHADSAREKLQKETHIYYHESSKLYKVHVLQVSPDNKTTLQPALASIRQNETYNDAFITTYSESDPGEKHFETEFKFEFQVHIEGVTKESEQAFLSSLQDSDSNSKNPEKDLIVFDNVETWDEAVKLQKNLSRITAIGKPILVLIEKSDD